MLGRLRLKLSSDLASEAAERRGRGTGLLAGGFSVGGVAGGVRCVRWRRGLANLGTHCSALVTSAKTSSAMKLPFAVLMRTAAIAANKTTSRSLPEAVLAANERQGGQKSAYYLGLNRPEVQPHAPESASARATP